MLDAGRAQGIVVHATLKKWRAFAAEVVHRRTGMVMQVVAEVRSLFIKTLLWHECMGFQVHAILLIEPHDAQAQPFVQHHPAADIGADLGDQGVE